jgi:hypothetical protein
VPLPYELALDTPKIVLSSIGITNFNNSLRGIVLLDEVLIIFGRAFDLRFGSTTFDAIMKALKVLHRGIWQSWVDGRVPSRGHKDDEFVLPWERVILTTLSSWGATSKEEEGVMVKR